MSETQLVQQLKGLDPEDEGEIDALAEEMLNESRQLMLAVIRRWRGGDAALSSRAALLLGRLGELPVTSMMQSFANLSGAQKVWAMRCSIMAEIALRRRAASRLRKALADKRAVPPAEPGGEMEEREIARRVCDEAYISLRRLVHISESLESALQNERLFLSLTEAEKDEEIRKAADSQGWTDFSEGL